MKHTIALLLASCASLCALPSAQAQSLDAPVASTPTLAPVAVPAPRAPTGGLEPPVTNYDTRQYHERATALFGVASLGYGIVPGINPYWNPGVNLAFTVRSVWSGFVLDAGLDVVFSGACLGRTCSLLSVQPSLRAGYSGSVGSRVALGFRGGYAPGLQFFSYNSPGFVHQIDADLHVTIATVRGALFEPFLCGGILIAQPLTPVAVLGLRIGAVL